MSISNVCCFFEVSIIFVYLGSHFIPQYIVIQAPHSKSEEICPLCLYIPQKLANMFYATDVTSLLCIYKATIKSKSDYGASICSATSKKGPHSLNPKCHKALHILIGTFPATTCMNSYSKHASVRERYNCCVLKRAAGWKRECLFNKCWNLFLVSSIITLVDSN